MCDSNRKVVFLKAVVFIAGKKNPETKKKFKLFPNPKETIILHHNGQIYSKSLAVIKISILMKNWQSIMSLSYIIPNFIRDFFYDII